MAASDAAPPLNNSHFAPLRQSSDTHQIPSKSDSNSLCKTLIVLIFLLLIPLFPSQAPDFITQTIFTDFWEIIHLLFIGIAVSYGLFGRRTAQIAPDRLVDPRNDDPHSYLSGVSHLTSIFDDGYENVCYELDTMNSYVNLDGQFLGKDGCVVHSGAKIRSFVGNAENEGVSVENGNHQAWYSQHSKGESLVVVSNGKCFLGGNSDFKPLNLPVRSLRSRAVDNDKNEFKNMNEFIPKVDVKGDDGAHVVKIRGVVPMNLEKKFEEVAERSTIPWRSRSGRMENGEETSTSKLPAHSRPHSVGEFEFEHLKSRSIRGSEFSGSPEFKSSNVERLERKRVFAASHSKVAPIDSEESSLFSGGITASSDMGAVVKSETNPKSSSVEEEGRKGKQAIESMDSDGAKSSSHAKALPRAKSVRTIKPKKYTMNPKEQCSGRGDARFGRVFIKSESDIVIKRREDEPVNPSSDDHQNQESTHVFSIPKPKPTLPEFHNEEKQYVDDRDATKSEDKGIEFVKSEDDDDARTYIDTESELGSEVDRKADEFIAKFREQIRLQKTLSMERFSGWKPQV